MTTQLVEVLTGLSSFDVDFKHDAAIVDELPLYDHALFFEGEQLLFTGVIHRRRPRNGAHIGGANIEWWLGQNSDGLVIEDREYIAGTNKLSNGGFEDQGLLWRPDEDTKWVFSEADPFEGDWAAEIDGTPDDDEVLQSNESFECRPGDEFLATLRVKRESAAVDEEPGRIRLRVVFEGRFRHPNLLAGTTWTDSSDYPDDAEDDGTNLVFGPVTERQSIQNSSFEAVPGLEHWYDQDARGWVTTGPPDIGQFEGYACVTIPAYGAGGGVLMYDDDETTAPPAVEPISVVPGEKIFMQVAVTAYAAAGGATAADGRVYAGVLLLDIADANPVFFRTDVLTADDLAAAWTVVSTEFTVPDDRVRAIPFIQTYDVTVGTWGFDAFTLTHQERNYAMLQADAVMSVTPKHTYRLTASVTSDASVTEGKFQAYVIFGGAPGRDFVVLQSPAMDPTRGEDRLFSFDVEPPSGYTLAFVTLFAVDVDGGSFRVRKSSVAFVDSDASKKVYDDGSPSTTTGYDELSVSVDAPAGAERVHVEIVADDGAAGWAVDAASLTRRETPDAAENIVAELLKSPTTNDQVVPEGTIHPAGTINYDWRLRLLTNREALKHLSRSGLLDELREWRANPDASLDWGTPEELFVDRTDFVLTEENRLILRAAPVVEDNASERLTKVKVLGADRTPVGGRKQIITGAAEASTSAVDWFGNPLERTRIVEDSTVDTIAFANARATYELERTGTPANSVTLELADWRAAGKFDVGDWIYAYVPAAELVDETHKQEWEGRTIAPARKRVIARTRKLGAGQFRVVLRAGDGTPRDVTEFVAWENETSASIELGDARPEFALDSQGGAAGQQFRRYRGSTIR